MPVQTSYSEARANFARFLSLVTDNNEVVIIKRRGGEPVALIAESELRSLEETAHLLRSPKNAERLLTALLRARRGQGEPSSVKDLRHRLGLADEA
jgi:antitoxin YefM